MDRSLPDNRLDAVARQPAGLRAEEARVRRQRYGENHVLEAKRGRWWGLAADTASDPMAWFLIATAGLFAWLGDVAEAMVLSLALIPLIGMDAFLHWRTQASTEGLRERLASRARVMRDGAEAEVASTELVPGDLVLLGPGEWAPADGVIETCAGLQADESSLTGEAMPVEKSPLDARQLLSVGAAVDEQHWMLAGARVLTGEARVRLVFTGADTLYGQIVRSVHAERRERTPLQQAIARLVGVLLVAALAACLALALARWLQGHGLADALLSAVTLAVAALPEEFPVVFTFFLGVGVFRLAQRRALVRRGVAVENIGRVSCICSDKTGTLTEGRLSLEHVLTAPGYESADTLRVAVRASRRESADPVDLAILERGGDVADEIVATFPFAEDRRRETSIRRNGHGLVASVKGAPETVLALTRLSEEEKALWIGRVEELAAGAHKVIVCAELRLESWNGEEPAGDYMFAGLLAFEDPLREGAAEAVADARAAGIRVIVVTGDHAATARAIAQALNLGGGAPVIIEGEALASRLQSGDADAVAGFDVVARATPAQKHALVQRLREAGEIVAVTGDGVNDAPALRAADIGIAMGQRGAQTSREVAAIVLLDDSFGTIVRAIAEGRQLFRNLRLSFAYLLMVHGPLVTTAAVIPFMGEPLLYLPAHIVWLELIIHPTALLVFQELPKNEGRAIGERSSRGFFAPAQWVAIAVAGALMTATVFAAYQHGLGLGPDYARSAALTHLVFASAAVAAALSRLQTRTAIIAFAATVLSAFVFVQIPILAGILHLTPLRIIDFVWATAGAAVVAIAALLLRESAAKPQARALA